MWGCKQWSNGKRFLNTQGPKINENSYTHSELLVAVLARTASRFTAALVLNNHHVQIAWSLLSGHKTPLNTETRWLQLDYCMLGMAVFLVYMKSFLLLLKHTDLSWAWSNMPVITSLGKWKQDQEFEVILDSITRLRHAWATGDPDSKWTKKHNNLITENKDLIFSYCHP